ncbi:MAG: hypothetical protein NVS3B7_04370 [Candidatus Elarobacter sp.]
MDNHERVPAEGAEPTFDRRRGPRRNADGSTPVDDRRHVDRRKTPGVNALLDDILSSRIDSEPSAD